jgi:isopentenyl diphosphate isomerase/L-lactate dehydrogenase-like FMN-dependent dehydrogenase
MAVNEDDSDETLLAIAGEGEQVTMTAYQKALTDTQLLPKILRVLKKQRTHIEIFGRLVRSFRTLRAA